MALCLFAPLIISYLKFRFGFAEKKMVKFPFFSSRTENGFKKFHGSFRAQE